MNRRPSRPPTAVDQVRMIVRQVAQPSRRPSDVTGGFVCVWPSLAVSLDEAAELSESVAWDEQAQSYAPFIAEQRHSHMSWGADGAALTLLIDLANNVAAETVVGGIAYAVGRMRGKRPKSPPAVPGDDLEAAKRQALSAVVSIFDEAYDDLAVTDVVAALGSVRVAVAGRADTYSATVGVLDTGDPFVRAVRDSE